MTILEFIAVCIVTPPLVLLWLGMMQVCINKLSDCVGPSKIIKRRP